MATANMNFNSNHGQPLRINNGKGQTVIVIVNPKTQEFEISTEGNPIINYKDDISILKINEFSFG